MDNVTPPGLSATVSTEEVTNLNGAPAPAQHIQRLLLAIRVSDSNGADLPGDATYGLGVDIKRLPNVAAPLNSPVAVRLSDGSSALGTTAGRLHVDDGGQSLTVDGALDTNALGTWGYKAGASGTPGLAGKRVLKISALGGTSDGSLTINGGDTITIKANSAFGIELRGNLVAPTLVFTGTAAYFVETIG